MKVYICFDSTGFMDSQKGPVAAVFMDKAQAQEWANKRMCFVEEYETQDEKPKPKPRKRCPGCNKVIRKMDTWCGTCAQYSWATPYMAGGSGEVR